MMNLSLMNYLYRQKHSQHKFMIIWVLLCSFFCLNIEEVSAKATNSKSQIESPIDSTVKSKSSSDLALRKAKLWNEVVDYAQKQLPQEGILKAKEDGYTYLKVDDRYIKTLFPMLDLQKEGFNEPPYFRSKIAPGAHISVFHEDENIQVSEIGKTFRFTLKEIKLVHTRNASYVVLQVAAPELEKLRESYGLKPKLQGHEFHISLAKKKSRHS